MESDILIAYNSFGAQVSEFGIGTWLSSYRVSKFHEVWELAEDMKLLEVGALRSQLGSRWKLCVIALERGHPSMTSAPGKCVPSKGSCVIYSKDQLPIMDQYVYRVKLNIPKKVLRVKHA